MREAPSIARAATFLDFVSDADAVDWGVVLVRFSSAVGLLRDMSGESKGISSLLVLLPERDACLCDGE